VLATQPQGRLAGRLGLGVGLVRGVAIVRVDPRLATLAEALQQMADGAWREGQLLGDLGGVLAGLPPLPDRPPDRNRNGTWHGDDSRRGTTNGLPRVILVAN
jgi:hypothetical protein